jgi:protease-4
VITASVEDAYEIFVNKVADSRELTAERADSVARGRVWIGSDALDLGLVDHLGSIDDAVAAAASRAGLDEGSYDVRTLEPELTLGQRMALGFVGTALAVGRHLGPLAIDPRPDGLIATAGRALEREWRTLSMLNDPRGLYLHCLCMID